MAPPSFHVSSILLLFLFTQPVVHCSDISEFSQLFLDQNQVAAQHLRAERKQSREEAALATAKAEEQAAKEQALLEEQEATRAAWVAKGEARRNHLAILEKEKKQEKAINEYSVDRDSYKSHVEQMFYIKPKTSSRFCMSIPGAVDDGYSGNLRVVLKKCDTSDSTQLFIYDPTSDRIYTESSRTWCLGYDIDQSISGKPLTLYKCNKVWSASVEDYDQWTFINGSTIVNTATNKCLDATPAVGNSIKQSKCVSGTRTQNWIWVPQEWYKATETGRNFIV